MTSRRQQKASRPKQVTGIVLNAGDVKTVPALDLTVGAESQTMTVSATAEMIPVENGAHTDVLSAADIDNLALEGRDTTELLKVLPGTVTTSGGLTQTAPAFSDLNITVDEGGVGNGLLHQRLDLSRRHIDPGGRRAKRSTSATWLRRL